MTAPIPRIDLFDTDGRPLALGPRLHDSGEATLFQHGDEPDLLIKLHHAPTEALRDKLALLPGLAPVDPSLDTRHRNFAWPVSTVYNNAGAAVGVILPVVPGARSVTAISNAKLRAKRAAEMDWHYLHAVAANIAFLFERLHDQGIIIGDVKPENILIDDRALATLIDCDSVQIMGPDGTPYLCTVGSEGFTAPEWIGRRFTEGPRNIASDRFGLAVVLYQLLTGAHPWTGEWMGSGEPPSRDQLIRSGDWPFKPGARLRPVPGMLSLDALAPGVASLFRQAFIAGAKDPNDRPSAAEWHGALCTALAELDVCETHSHHHYDESLSACPWCIRVKAGLPDLFPKPDTPRDPFAPLILAFERALARGDTRMAVDLWRGNPVLARCEDLKRLIPQMRQLDGAITALDQWIEAYARVPQDIGELASLVEDFAILSDPSLFGHEEIDGQPIAETVKSIANAAVTIPPTPCQTIEITTQPAQSVTAIRPSPVAAPTQSLDPIISDCVVSYTIENGWRGLRPARLILAVEKPCVIPSLTLSDEETGDCVLHIPAQRLRGATSLPFDTPDGRITLVLHTTQDSDKRHIKINGPSRRARTLGITGSVLPLSTQMA
jgi:protein kinase-like protein